MLVICLTDEMSSVIENQLFLFGLLPMEMKLKILKYTGHDTYFAVTEDRVGADTILLTEKQFIKYFDTRRFNYCINVDYRLTEYFKRQDYVRLPLLVDGLFQTYVKTHLNGYVMADDVLLKTFFGNKDITNLSLLIDGQFCKYQRAMHEKGNGTYDPANDALLLQYLGSGANEDNIVECFDRLIDFDKMLRLVADVEYTIGKLFALRRIKTKSLYKFFSRHRITLPECLMPMNLAKVLITYTRCFESAYLMLSGECVNCQEPSIGEESILKLLDNDWEDLYVILFCSKCTYCLLNLPYS